MKKIPSIYTNSIWEIIEDDKILFPYTRSGSYNTKGSILFEVSSDDEDGTYPRVSDYTRLANKIDSEGACAWINRLSNKRDKKSIDMLGCKIIRKESYENQAIIEFENPVNVVFGHIGESPIIKQVKKIKGEFEYDWFFRKGGRQNKIANGFDIWFDIKEYLE